MEAGSCTWDVALVIGVGAYRNDQHVLRNAEQDAGEMAYRLRAMGCKVHECLSPSRSAFHEAIAGFCKSITHGSDVVFYYSGHGVVHPDTNQHLLMCKEWEDPSSGNRIYDAEHAGVSTQGTLELIADRVGTGSLVAFLDTCRERIAHAGGKGFKGAAMSREGDTSLKVEGVNVLCCHACRDSGLASAGQGPFARFSPYTEQLLQHLFNPQYESLLDAVSAANLAVITGGYQQRPEMVLLNARPFNRPFFVTHMHEAAAAPPSGLSASASRMLAPATQPPPCPSHWPAATTPAAQAKVLLAGKARLQDPEGRLSSWRLHQPLNTWRGVTCDEKTGLVTDIWLHNNQLSGRLPPEWSAISSLEVLYVYNNQLTGPLPPEWSALSGMKVLDLEDNQLTGPLPPEWSALSSLNKLYLKGNQLSGPLPPDWSALSSLEILYVGNNQLTGSLPPKWSVLRGLQQLSLRDNQLTGPLPPEWSALRNLNELSLHNNQLSGPLPPEWSALSSLGNLSVYNNQGLCGSLPAVWRGKVKIRDRMKNSTLKASSGALHNTGIMGWSDGLPDSTSDCCVQ